MGEIFLAISGISGAAAVGLGAFAAHALRQKLPPERRETFETAVRYHFYHTLALLAVGLLARMNPQPATLLSAAGWSFLAGILLFSGSLYLLVATGKRWLGAITPLGGIAFILGWVCLALSAGF